MGLRSQYTAYVAALNERRFGELDRFVADDVVHNARPLGIQGYRGMLEDDVATFPDLFFGVAHLAVDGDLVAARLRFDVTPVEPFRGFAPTRTGAQFSEHVFYRFVEGRIAEVWSLIDHRRPGPTAPTSPSVRS